MKKKHNRWNQERTKYTASQDASQGFGMAHHARTFKFGSTAFYMAGSFILKSEAREKFFTYIPFLRAMKY